MKQAGTVVSLFYIFFLVLALSPAPLGAEPSESDGDSDSQVEDDGDTTADGDQTSDDPARDCLLDTDCESGEICRDDGRCIPEDCEIDADCNFGDFYCREDKTCGPIVCVVDNDCLTFELCLQGSCLADPTTYVEGGVTNCQTMSLPQRWPHLILIAIGVLMLLWIRFRRNRT